MWRGYGSNSWPLGSAYGRTALCSLASAWHNKLSFSPSNFQLVYVYISNLLQPILAKRPITGTQANSADPDQEPQNVASDQCLHCLLIGISIKKGENGHGSAVGRTADCPMQPGICLTQQIVLFSQQLSTHACLYLKLLTHISLVSHFWDKGKQCSPRSDTAECGLWSVSSLFAFWNFYKKMMKMKIVHQPPLKTEMDLSNW